MIDDGLEGKRKGPRGGEGQVFKSLHTLGPRGGARSFPVSVEPSSVYVNSLADLVQRCSQ